MHTDITPTDQPDEQSDDLSGSVQPAREVCDISAVSPETQDTLPREHASLQAGKARAGHGYYEQKTINGHRYWYLRWREGDRRRSRYIGKYLDEASR
ncbi:MAG: hypothetical protein GX491_05340 [Chloroflexi bacterium]|nr:hypothetical protein [Chloroflexota bacterium]